MPGPARHPHTHDVVGEPVGVLRSHGLRATEPRLRLLAALTAGDHLTAEALHRRLADDGIALTTVYRTLESLEQAGLVWATQVPDLGRTYHLGSHARHAHLYCRVCGSLTDVPGEAPAWAVPDGFEVDDVQVTILGRCAACRAATPPAAEPAPPPAPEQPGT